ncbi:hypothetical protein FHK92_04795 [Pseudomonas brassicacearum subsp. neoaurantiaca]|uniref:Uncharacterized protein n=1 Tax=Pseudomonas brassicacearum subsp. neoaurantiaca TaxID=494916 RepID=A0A7V8UB43_9PSED|nr:hypothetical protein [Pseudomonas brassicacearum subsp. neoaurantiaca]
MARELAPAGLRSRPLEQAPRWVRLIGFGLLGVAAQPSGSKLPRHGDWGSWENGLSTLPLWRGDLSPLDCAAGPWSSR